MEESARKTVLEIIRGAINDLAMEELAKMPEKLAQKQKQIKATKSQRNKQVDDDLFYGGDTKKGPDTRLRLRENEMINVSKSELDNFQKEFSTHLQGHTVKFQTNMIGGKSSIAAFPTKDGSIDAIVSGTIDDKIEFTMSLTGGLKIRTKGVNITDETKELPLKLYNLYNKIFKQKFSEIISPKEDKNINPQPEMPIGKNTPAGTAPGNAAPPVGGDAPAGGSPTV
jgi:hypothetical protein